MYVIGAEDVERLCAWKKADEVSFSFADARLLRRVRKRNTFLFDALTDIAGYAYHVSEGVLDDMLVEAVLVDFAMSGHVRCLDPGDANKPQILPASLLQKTLYEHGFHMVRADGVRVHFVPFVASASMSRKQEYLFVNEERLDALLRAVSLDMVGAVDGMAVLDGEPMPRDPRSPFGGLQMQKKVASVPKLAAYLGLALSDGVSLRERWAAAQDAEIPVADGAARAQWLLGLHEDNTVCVADWSDAPMHLDAFDFCWVNEETPLTPAFLPSKYVMEEQQAEMQRELQGLFRALQGNERQAYDELLRQQGGKLCELWGMAITHFFKHLQDVDLPEGLIPRLPDSPQGTSVYLCAALYAACLLLTEKEELTAEALTVLLTADRAQGDAQSLSAADLTALVCRLQAETPLQNRLWNMLHDQNPATNLLLRAWTERKKDATNAGLRLWLRRAPCRRFRAALRSVPRADDRFNSGKLYDGCGFLDDALFDDLEWQLRGGPRPLDQEPLNAVQIRLPWCKGLLVRFTASEYFRAFAQEAGQPVAGLCIRDIFGQVRPLFDADGRPMVHAVFTGSMFKGADWFAALEDRGQGGDRWAEYWRRLRAHGASLLVAGKSTQPDTTSRLNYQFLTTLGLEADELEALVERRLRELNDALQMKPIPRLRQAPLHGSYRMAKMLMGLAEPEEDEELTDLPANDEDGAEDAQPQPEEETDSEDRTQGAEAEDYLTLLGQALATHPDSLMDTDLVMGRFKTLVHGEVLQMMRGRIPVAGDVRYLLPDLLEMVRHMARSFLCLPDGTALPDGGAEIPVINALSGDAPCGFYYAPGRHVPWVHRTGRLGEAGSPMPVAVLRNPHYAMGEEPILQPLQEKDRAVYERWFGQLTGCVMAPSAMMYAINGADCDGDRVNVCAEPSVLRAIRRRARRENALLAKVIAERDAIAAWLGEKAEELHGNREAREYLQLLQAELPSILPDAPAGGVKVHGYHAPLVYAGSSAKGAVFSRKDLQGRHLRDKLWDAFEISRRQRIGQMSLRVLALTADAYGPLPQDAERAMDAQQLTGSFLARYRVISSALDTAMEIDMAKTGALRENHALKSVPEKVRELLGLGRKSGFLLWRGLYGKYERRLNGYGFDAALEKMMQEFVRGWKLRAGAPTLDLLPMIVYRLYAPERAGRVFSCAIPEREEKAPAIVQEQSLEGRGKRPLARVLRAPQADALAALRQKRADGSSLMEELQGTFVAQDRARRISACAAAAAEGLAGAYRAILRWQLMNGSQLDDALAGMDMIREMLRRWRGTAAEPLWLCDVFARLTQEAKDQSNAVRWGWSADMQTRAGILEEMLQKALGPDVPADALTFTR